MTLNPWRLRLLADLEAHGTIRAVAKQAAVNVVVEELRAAPF
jgi:hypothetical protein